jgi:hypothetical protein
LTVGAKPGTNGQGDQTGTRREDRAMTVARDLAEFLTRTSSADLPPQAVEHAAMLIASTLASAAMGAGLEIIGDHPRPFARAGWDR